MKELSRLATDLGERSTYDASSQCSRCGYCEQACPTYVATGSESRSPRGRNQVVRLMLEGKLNDPEAAREVLATCLLCGACSSACYARVPTADIVLEGRRLLSGEPPWIVKMLTSMLIEQQERLSVVLKAANFFKRWGLSRLFRPLLRRLGFSVLAEADAHVGEAPGKFLFEYLRDGPAVQKPAWHYFAPCGPNYLYPRVGQATVNSLERLKGPGRFMENSCCGLLSYNYGDLDDARTLAKKNMLRALEAGASQAPIVGDCSSCVSFLKTYPQLFLDDPEWKGKAEAFSSRVRDAVEMYAGNSASAGAAGPVTYHDSCRACHGQGIKTPPRDVMRSLFADTFVELPEADVCCGGAGAFSFVQPELSDEVLKRKIGRIAETGAVLVATSSTSCLIQLAHGLKKYYPQCRVVHLSELVAGTTVHHG